jgi:hypothetical protein
MLRIRYAPVYFTDRMLDRIYHLGLDGKITVYQEHTGATNGLALTREGESEGWCEANWQNQS